jgi:hypothetical protein
MTYGIMLNNDRYTNFKDKAGRPALPYLLSFTTKPATTTPASPVPDTSRPSG